MNIVAQIVKKSEIMSSVKPNRPSVDYKQHYLKKDFKLQMQI
jgi:hypothetical protein